MIKRVSLKKQDIKRNQVEILDLKNTIIKIKNLVNGLNSRIEGTKEKTCPSVNMKTEQ